VSSTIQIGRRMNLREIVHVRATPALGHLRRALPTKVAAIFTPRFPRIQALITKKSLLRFNSESSNTVVVNSAGAQIRSRAIATAILLFLPSVVSIPTIDLLHSRPKFDRGRLHDPLGMLMASPRWRFTSASDMLRDLKRRFVNGENWTSKPSK